MELILQVCHDLISAKLIGILTVVLATTYRANSNVG